MNPTPRNPRGDPQPGDVLTKTSVTRVLVREVKSRVFNTVIYRTVGKEYACNLTTWRTWAQDAKVKTVGAQTQKTS